jgi:hypothetical protein
MATRRRKVVNRELKEAGVKLLDRQLGTALVHGVRAVKGATRRTNPPLPVRTFGSRKGHLVSRTVLFLDYYNVGSAQRSPYRHEFQPGVEMWAMADGTLMLRGAHGQRLWEDFFVRDGE